MKRQNFIEMSGMDRKTRAKAGVDENLKKKYVKKRTSANSHLFGLQNQSRTLRSS